MWSLFATPMENEWGEIQYIPTTFGYVCIVIAILLCMALALYWGRRKTGRKITTQQIAFSAAAMALGLVLSNFKLFKMPMGGSITLCSMLFLTLIGYWYGLKAGIMSGVAYGMLQLIIDPYVLSIPQMLCDYPLAFGALGLSGLFCDKRHGLLKGYIAGVLGRFVFSFLSGYVFFYYYAPEGMNPALYSLGYNGGYLGAEALVTLAVIAIPAVAKALMQVKSMALADSRGR